MALYTNININKNFIKYKGKIYKKTTSSEEVDSNTIIDSVEENYDTVDQALYQSTLLTDSIYKLRPVYMAASEEIIEPAQVNSGLNTFDVRVEVKSNQHPFFNVGSSVCFSISGFQNVQLNLIRGKSYKFKQLHESNSSQKLRITTDAEGLCAVNFPVYGYTGTPGVDGELFFIIPPYSLQDYFLSSDNETYMGLKINVDKFQESFPLDVAYYNLLSGVDYYKQL